MSPIEKAINADSALVQNSAHSAEAVAGLIRTKRICWGATTPPPFEYLPAIPLIMLSIHPRHT